MSKVSFKAITIRAAEEENDSRLFVLNRCNPLGNINMNVTSSNGEKHVITLPISPCPIDMTNWCEKNDILRTPIFRRLVAAGHIAIIETAQAADFVENDPRGQRETRRIFKANTEGDQFLNGNDGTIESTFSTAAPKTLAEEVGAQAPDIFIESIVVRSKSEDADDLISELDSRLNTLTLNDIEYLSNHAHAPAIKAWAVEVLPMFQEGA